MSKSAPHRPLGPRRGAAGARACAAGRPRPGRAFHRALAIAILLLAVTPAARAEDALPFPTFAPGETADPAALGDAVTRWLQHFDRAIRAIAAPTDRIAGGALTTGFGPLAHRHDDEMGRQSDALLVAAPAAAHARFTLERDRPARDLHVAAHSGRRRPNAPVDAAPPARPER